MRLGLRSSVQRNVRSCTWGKTNPKDYFIAEKKIGVTECERDLDVLFWPDGTWQEQVYSAALKPPGF